MKKIKKVGVELEGGWFEAPLWLAHDGSVGDFSEDVRAGELQSPPFADEDGLFSWIRENYPDRVNGTCGMHVHISLKNRTYYQRLMSSEFADRLHRRMEEWGDGMDITNRHFWSRQRGDNQYCQRRFKADSQWAARTKSTERYTHLNYCWRLHGTLEYRALPMFKSREIGIAAIRVFLDCVEGWLSDRASREGDSISVTVETYEEEGICV